MEGNNGRAKVWFEVSCPRHGKVASQDKTNTPRVAVQPPDNKRERMSGCPLCRSEKDGSK